MGTRKTTFEVVSLETIAPLIGGRKPESAGDKAAAGRILSIAYDQILAATREMLFSSIGLYVASALTLGGAIELCRSQSFDLIVVGHSIPRDHRQSLVKELGRYCDAPILALYRPVEPALPGADYTFDSTQSPAALLAAITNILKSKPSTFQENASIS
jgi:hypothetical protein